MTMTRITLALLAAVAFATGASAASVVNTDSEARTLVVTESGAKAEVSVGAGETVSICPTGCFVTLPNGDRATLTGSETLEISSGAATIR
jgi:hypothetical protein